MMTWFGFGNVQYYYNGMDVVINALVKGAACITPRHELVLDGIGICHMYLVQIWSHWAC